MRSDFNFNWPFSLLLSKSALVDYVFLLSAPFFHKISFVFTSQYTSSEGVQNEMIFRPIFPVLTIGHLWCKID